MNKPVTTATAVAIFRDEQVFVVLRPGEPGEELPGLWGLPAASQRGEETAEERLRRLAREKLGLSLTVGALLARGRRERPSYILEMEIYSATSPDPPRLPPRPADPSDVTYYVDWRWASPEILRPAAEQGSLCAQLLLGKLGRGE